MRARQAFCSTHDNVFKYIGLQVFQWIPAQIENLQLREHHEDLRLEITQRVIG
jgi:hypothetical protein